MSSRPCHRQTFPVAPVPWVHTHGSMLRSLRNYSCSLLTHRGLTPTALSPGPYGTFRALSHRGLVPTALSPGPYGTFRALSHRGLTPTALSPGPYGTIRAPYSLTVG